MYNNNFDSNDFDTVGPRKKENIERLLDTYKIFKAIEIYNVKCKKLVSLIEQQVDVVEINRATLGEILKQYRGICNAREEIINYKSHTKMDIDDILINGAFESLTKALDNLEKFMSNNAETKEIQELYKDQDKKFGDISSKICNLYNSDYTNDSLKNEKRAITMISNRHELMEECIKQSIAKEREKSELSASIESNIISTKLYCDQAVTICKKMENLSTLEVSNTMLRIGAEKNDQGFMKWIESKCDDIAKIR